VKLAPARRVSLHVLGEVRRREAWVRPVLDVEILAADLSTEDAALARSLTLGTTQMLGSVDFAIDRFANKPSSIEPRVRDALRMSSHEILFMNTPQEVAVHQGVEAVRARTPRATGMANAVLRRISEQRDTFPWVSTDDAEGRSLATGHPLWLVQRLDEDLGTDMAEAMLTADNTPPPLYLSTNPALIDDGQLAATLDAAGASPEPYGPPGCFRIEKPALAIASGVLDEVQAIVSDAAAQSVAQLAVPPEGGTVIEVGAGRGTKSLLVLAHARRLGVPLQLTCIDNDKAKLNVTTERIAAAGYDRQTMLTVDLTTEEIEPSLLDSADAVLVDAPCSGLGTLRRHPEKRWTLDPDSPAALGQLGLTMLRKAASLVRPGGFVVYSTCTVLKVENDEVVDAFLGSAEGKMFADEPFSERVPDDFRAWMTQRDRMQTLPTDGGPDGHFAAVLRRDGEDA